MPRTESTETRQKPLKGYKFMGVQVNSCHQDFHIVGVCPHPGSKPDLKKRQNKRRAKNKVARHSRRINRAHH